MPVKGGDKLQKELQRMAGAVSSAQSVRVGFLAGSTYVDGKPVEVLGIARDITWRKRAEEVERGRRQILEMAARHEPLPAVMLRLARLVESQFPQSVCSIKVSSIA